jgi:uncharacterized protein (DUF2062 family)
MRFLEFKKLFTKVKKIIIDQMKKGASPEKLTQSVLGGILIGIFPILGTTMTMAAVSASIWKLNHIVIQTVNYLLYPVQIIMIPVYIKAVSLMFDVGHVPLRPDLIMKQFTNSPKLFLKQYTLIGLYAIILWAFLSIVLYLVLYPIILKVILKLQKRRLPPKMS